MCMPERGIHSAHEARAHEARQWCSVVPIIFLEFLAMAMPSGVLPIMISDHYGARAYLLTSMGQAVRGLLAFLASPAIGALSDLLGRKHLFVICITGSSAPYAILGLGASLDTHIAALGLSGALSATFPLAFAYIADVVPTHARAAAFGSTIGLGMGGAFLLGPLAGTMIEHHFGDRALFRVCLWITVLNAAFALAVLREKAHPPPAHTGMLLRRANPFASFALLRRNRALRLLCGIVLLYYFALWGFVANKGIYARRRFGQTSRQTAEQLTVFGLSAALSQSVG